MLRPQYIVLQLHSEWRIRHDGKHYGPYDTEREAVFAAIEAADKAGSHGHEARVLVQSGFTGHLQVEWTRGDPYPHDMQLRNAVAGKLENQKRQRGWGVLEVPVQRRHQR